MAKLTSLTFRVAQTLEWEERGGVEGLPSGAMRLARGAVLDWSFRWTSHLSKMYVSDWDQTSVPSSSFHVLEKQGGGGGGQKNDMEEGRTSEIVTFSKPSPYWPGRADNIGPPRTPRGQLSDREQAGAWSKHSDSAACYTLLVAMRDTGLWLMIKWAAKWPSSPNEAFNCPDWYGYGLVSVTVVRQKEIFCC